MSDTLSRRSVLGIMGALAAAPLVDQLPVSAGESDELATNSPIVMSEESIALLADRLSTAMLQRYIVLPLKPGTHVVKVKPSGDWHVSRMETYFDSAVSDLGFGLADETGQRSERDSETGEMVASWSDALHELRQPAPVIAVIAAVCDAMRVPWGADLEEAMQGVEPINPWSRRTA